MTKLDWRKGKLREADPARQQPLEDFVEPDPVTLSVTPLTRRELSKHLTRQKKERRDEAMRWPSRIAAEARERERLLAEAADRAKREAAREARQRDLARKAGAKKARGRGGGGLTGE